MGFMDAFSTQQRALFADAAEELPLERGSTLLRRGEPGGDLFVLSSGTLEVVDTRSTPETILAVLREGAAVGELSFVDGSPRMADVRAGSDCLVLRWGHRDLRALLKREPDFAAAFYESVAQIAATRMRRVTDSAVAGNLGAGVDLGVGLEKARAGARAIAEQAKSGLFRSETQLRENPNAAGNNEALRDNLNTLQDQLNNLMASLPGDQARKAITETLQRELHPYLVRSTLADRAIRRPQGIVGTAETLSHVLVDRPSGEGRLGELLDRWLLDRPTLQAVRELRRAIPKIVSKRLTTRRNRRVLLLNAGTGSVVAGLTAYLAEAPTVLTVVDTSRESLAFLDTDVAPVDPNVQVVALQENLAEFAVGRVRRPYPPQDIVVIHGLVEYLPDRLVVSLLRVCGRLLNRQGAVVCASLADSADRNLLDRLLRWPTIRRSTEALVRVHEDADFRPTSVAELPAPAVLLTADAPVARTPSKR